MATVPKPPRERKALTQNFQTRLGEPPPAAAAPRNLSAPASAELKDMNFKVDPDFHTEFKIEATKRGMKMNEFLKVIYLAYMQSNR